MEEGGCACWDDDSCDEASLVPEGCDSCAEQAAVSCEMTDDEGEPATTTSELLTTETVVANPSRARMEELKSIYKRKPNAMRFAAVSSLVDVIVQEFPNMEVNIAEQFEKMQSFLERS